MKIKINNLLAQIHQQLGLDNHKLFNNCILHNN